MAFLLRIVLAALALDIAYGGVNEVPLPCIELDEWWGPGEPTEQDTSINDFKVEFSDSMLKDLKRRLKNYRPSPPPLEGIEFEYGFNTDALELWRQYWLKEYPFKKREQFLNQFSHHTTQIQGLKIHFMRATAEHKKGEKLTPLMISHGWPGSPRQFYEAVPYLLSIGKANGLALDIIMPSLPGFAYSEGAHKPGLGVDKAAVVIRNLMHRIGHSKYFIQGGDMGGLVTMNLATLFPDEVLGYHTNFPLVHTPEMIFRLLMGNFHKDEIAPPELLDRIYPSWDKFSFYVGRSGYLHLQATMPDTYGVGLTDSPLGLVAHTMYTTGTPNNTGDAFGHRTPLQLLDNVMIFWSTRCVTTAMRLYSETFNKRYVNLRINEIRTPVPTWVLQAPDELIYVPDSLLKLKFPNFIKSSLPPTGSHFYAWSKPKEFGEDVIASILAFNEWHAKNSTLCNDCSSYIMD